MCGVDSGMMCMNVDTSPSNHLFPALAAGFNTSHMQQQLMEITTATSKVYQLVNNNNSCALPWLTQPRPSGGSPRSCSCELVQRERKALPLYRHSSEPQHPWHQTPVQRKTGLWVGYKILIGLFEKAAAGLICDFFTLEI